MMRQASAATCCSLSLLLVCCAGLCATVAPAPTTELIAYNDTPVAETLAERVAWLGDERGLVIGGWAKWPRQAQIIVAPNSGSAVALDSPATPYFALSPDRRQVAYWLATGSTWVHLVVVPLAGGTLRTIGEPRQADAAMQLAWPVEGVLCALTQGKTTCSALAIPLATGVPRTLVEVEGGEWTALQTPPGSDPIAVWADKERKCFRLSALGQSEELSADFAFDRARPTSPYYSYFDPTGALWLGGQKGLPPQKIADDAGAACWSADGAAVAFARKAGVWIVRPEAPTPRPLPGTDLDVPRADAVAPRGMSWSGDGGALAYWGSFGGKNLVRRLRLARLEVAVQAAFPKSAQPALGQRLWVATKLARDAAGRVREPVWKTLKGQFVVRKVTVGPRQVVVQAVSAGSGGGILERLTAVRPVFMWPERGAPQRVILAPRRGLCAWLQGTHVAGVVTEVLAAAEPIGQ